MILAYEVVIEAEGAVSSEILFNSKSSSLTVDRASTSGENLSQRTPELGGLITLVAEFSPHIIAAIGLYTLWKYKKNKKVVVYDLEETEYPSGKKVKKIKIKTTQKSVETKGSSIESYNDLIKLAEAVGVKKSDLDGLPGAESLSSWGED